MFPSIHVFHLFKTDLNDQGELEHRRVKRFYPRTNKVGLTQQIAKHQRRERLLHNLSKSSQAATKNNPAAVVGFQESDPLPYTSPTAHHHISNSNHHHHDLTAWLRTHSSDPALTVCYLFNCSLSVPETIYTRISFRVLKTTFLHRFLVRKCMEKTMILQTRNEVASRLSTIVYTGTKCFESTILHMICDVLKIP